MGKLENTGEKFSLKHYLTHNVPFIYLGKDNVLDDKFDVNSVICDYPDLLKSGTKVSLIDYIRDKINRTVIDGKRLEYVSHRLADSYPDPSSGLKYSRLTSNTYETTLYITYRVHFNGSYEEVEHPAFSLPIPTFRQTFVIKGTEYSLVSRMTRNSNIYTDVVYDRETSSMVGEQRFNITVQLKGDLVLPTEDKTRQDIVTFQLTFLATSSGKNFIRVSIRSLNMIRHQNFGTELDPELSQYDIFKEYEDRYITSIKANRTIMGILQHVDWEANNLEIILQKVFGVEKEDDLGERLMKVHRKLKQSYNNPASKSMYGREALYYKIIESPSQWMYREIVKIIDKGLFFNTFKGLTWNIFTDKNSRIRSLFLQSRLAQHLDDTNPVSEGSHKRRIIYDLELPTNDDRIYHSSYRGTVCPIETPESSKIGISLNYASGYKNTNKDTGYNIVALPPSLIPFLNKNDANRCLMGSNMLKQSLPLKKSRWSKVITENYLNMYDCHWTNIKSPVKGTVTSVGVNRIRIRKSGTKTEIPVEIYTNFSGNKKTNYTTVPKVKVGDVVKVGDALTESRFFKSGMYTPSTPLLAVYLPYNGYNFEDSIVISQRLVDEDILTSEWAETETLTFDKETLLPTQGFCDDYNISQDWVINSEVILSKIGQVLNSGDPLFHYFKPVKLVDDFIVKTDGGYPQNLLTLVDLRAHYDNSRIDAIYLLKDSEILDITDDNLKICTSIVICTSGCHKVEEGDKLSGVHGNKGTVSKILPAEMMPRLPDGTPVDIVLNTMGIPSRMNVGQLFELSLGLCSETLRRKLEEYGDTEKGRDYLRQLLVLLKKAIKPNHKLLDGLIKEVDNGLVSKMIETDVIFLMPQFQEITTDVVKLILRYLELPEDSSAHLYLPEFDTTTKRKVIYGYNTILKLEHMVKKKTKIRCNGLNNPDPTFIEHRGQRSGEMEFWALESHHATSTINEMLKYTSGNYQNKKKLYMGLMTGKVEINPGNTKSPTFEKFSEYMKALGFDIVESDKRVKLENSEEDNNEIK